MQSREDRRSTGQATKAEQDAAEGTGVARLHRIRPRNYCTWDSIPSEEDEQVDDQPLIRRRYADSSGDEWEVSQDTSFPTLILRRRKSRAATIEPEEAQSIPEAEPGTEAGVEHLDVIDFDLGLENVEEGYGVEALLHDIEALERAATETTRRALLEAPET